MADFRVQSFTDPVADSSGRVYTTDPRLTDARTPTAHAASHVGGTDPITFPSVAPLAHAATHGPAGSDPVSITATMPEVVVSDGSPALDLSIAAGFAAFVEEEMFIADGKEVVLEDGGGLVVI